MWEWFTSSGLWILVVSAIAMIILISLLHQIHDRIEKLHEKKSLLQELRILLPATTLEEMRSHLVSTLHSLKC